MKYIKKFESNYISINDMDDYHKIANMVYYNNIDIIKKKVENGEININSTNQNGFTPLMYLSIKNRYDYMEEFIKMGADIFKNDKKNNDFLYYVDDIEKALSVLKKFPELYEEYMKREELKNNIKKYNL